MIEDKYIENPKTKGSGIWCAIPQKKGNCPNNCEDCFFQSGRSYLEPLNEHLPNLPRSHTLIRDHRVIRVNDGHDSNFLDVNLIELMNIRYTQCFYNTAIPKWDNFGQAPFILTVNPGTMTDVEFHKIDPPQNLMFIRARVNTWNLDLIDQVVDYYSQKEVPIVLTFMAYFKSVNGNAQINLAGNEDYVYRKRTLNDYWAITTQAWRKIMQRYQDNKWVHSCGKIEGEKGDTHCRFCGNCLREYFATKERCDQK